jgi:hypothetical protein
MPLSRSINYLVVDIAEYTDAEGASCPGNINI